MFKVSLPKISQEELKKRYERIKPVINLNGNLYHFRTFELHELWDMSYLGNPEEDIREKVDGDELEILKGKDFVCLHSYDYYGWFKPSIKEVLSQISEQDIPFVRAFEIIQYPKTAEDFYKDSFTSIAFDNGYHVSTVRLYGEKR